MLSHIRMFVCLVVVLIAFAIAGNAQVTHVYVAYTGDDANPCTVALPCATIFKGVTEVDPGGEVVIIGNGNYDRFAVTKPVTIAAAEGIKASVIAEISYAAFMIGIPAGSTVNFRNLNFVGINNLAANGLNNSFGATVNIDNCTFTGFSSAVTASTNAGRIHIHDSTFRNNLFGVGAIGPVGEGITRVTIDNCIFESNEVGASFSGKVLANVRDSRFTSNNSRGIGISSSVAGQLTEVVVDNCQINHNTAGVLVGATNGGIASLWLARSTITRNKLSGVSMGQMATVFTLGNNTFFGNNPDVSGGSLTPAASR